MEKLNQKLGNEILNLLLVLAVVVAVLGFLVDLENTLTYGAVDLRNRVVASRLLIDGIDPYYFKWHPGMSDLFLDPIVDPSWPVSRATIPPTVLMFHAIIAKLPFFQQKVIWFLFQWGLLLSTLVIFAKITNSQIKSKLIIIIGLLFFSGSFFWRFHIERGQIYILYVFLLSCAYWLATKPFKFNHLLSGFLIGLTASLRPPMVIMLVPMLIYKQWKIVIGTIFGLLSGVLFSFTFAGIPIWKSYFLAMKVYERAHSGLLKFDSTVNAGNVNVENPTQIEGMNTLSKTLDVPFVDATFQWIFDRYLGINITSGVFIALLCIILLAISFFIYRNRSQNNKINLLFLSGISMVLISEYFVPMPRHIYNDIQWLLPLTLIVITYDLFELITNKLTIIILVSLVFSFGFAWLPPTFLVINDVIMLLYTVIMLLFIVKQNNKVINKTALVESYSKL